MTSSPSAQSLIASQSVSDEPRSKRVTYLLVALAITGGLWFTLFSYWSPGPGRPGIDENAYLVAGKNIAQHFTTGFRPTDDYQFLGAMWLRAKSGWYYPKYPYGLPLLNAISVLAGHREWAFAISPLCTCLAALGMFFLARGIVGSFYALLAMIVLATGPVTLQLANLPNSHAPALCAVVWGVFFLLRWARSGRWQVGVLAGLVLGFAVTIRYTEALLLFPLYSLGVLRTDEFIGPKLSAVFKVFGVLPLGTIGIAAISRVRWKDWRSYLRAAVPIAAWAVPVGLLVAHNWFTIGSLTGYDDTNESNGFSMKYFFEKWDYAVQQSYMYGAFMFLPLGIAGLILMYRDARRTALMLTMWFLPGALLYTAYYWGANSPSWGFLRFLLTLFPPLIIAAMWLLRSAQSRQRGSISSPLAAGILTAIAASVGLWTSIGELERLHRGNLNLHFSAQRVLAHVKNSSGRKPMILADGGMFPPLLQYMQFLFDADWYASDVFGPRLGGGFGLAGIFQKAGDDSKSPVVLQRERMEYVESIRKGKTTADFVRDAQRLIDQALDAGRNVYAVMAPLEAGNFRQRYLGSAYKMIELEKWTEPCAMRFPEEGLRSRLGMPVWEDDPITPWHPQTRAIFQIQRTPTSQPTTARR